MSQSQSPQAIAARRRKPRDPYKHLTQTQIARLLRYADDGVPQKQIAAILGTTDGTVSRCLERYADTRQLARRILEAKSHKLARTVTETRDAAVALKALGKLDVVREDAAGPGVNVAVMVGGSDDPVEPPVLQITDQGIPPATVPDPTAET